MKIKNLIEELKKLSDEQLEAEIFLSIDPEMNQIRTIDEVATVELPKSNNDGTYDAMVIFPTDTIINQDIPEEE